MEFIRDNCITTRDEQGHSVVQYPCGGEYKGETSEWCNKLAKKIDCKYGGACTIAILDVLDNGGFRKNEELLHAYQENFEREQFLAELNS